MQVAINPPFGILNLVEDLEKMATAAGTSSASSLQFYKAGARTTFFKLEGLCRLFKNTIDKDIFEELLKSFKAIEDVFGDYDYHESMYLGISSKSGVPDEFVNYFKKKMDDSQRRMDRFIKAEYWLPVDAGKYDALKKTLLHIDWPDLEKLKERIAKQIAKEMHKIREKYEEGELDPHDIENGMHEIRRKFRWISIYAQVLNGLIQLKAVEHLPDDLKMYHTPEVMKSPFNKLPPALKGVSPLYINDIDFFALSWVIAELGDLKDMAIKEEAISAALEACKITDKKDILKIRNIFQAPENCKDKSGGQAEIILDRFIYQHRIPERIERSLKRSLIQEL
ncbi:hypothetical protein BH11BAC2_BH11BAC2_22560 [soil metagenome]